MSLCEEWMVFKGSTINLFKKLACGKGTHLALWMAARTWTGAHLQKVAFPLYLAVRFAMQNCPALCYF